MADVLLIGDQQTGPAGQRDRDHDAMALATRELVRVGVEALRRLRQLHPLQQPQRRGARAGRRQAAVHAQRLAAVGMKLGTAKLGLFKPLAVNTGGARTANRHFASWRGGGHQTMSNPGSCAVPSRQCQR